MTKSNVVNDKTKALLAYKEKIIEELKYYEENIDNFRANFKNVSYYHDDSCDSEDDFPVPIDTGPSIPVLKLQQDKLKTCLQASQELTNLTVLQSEVSVMVNSPVIKGEKPVTEAGVWREVTADCRIDLVPFAITFYMHIPLLKFGAPSYRGLRVSLVKKSHETELEKSVLHSLKTPSDAVEVLRSYAKAYRSRRTTLAKLANKYANSLFMEPQPEGFILKCADLLEVSWKLENKWSPVAPFHHRMKFDLEYMDEVYIKIITQSHKQLLDPSIQTDERTLLLAKIITTCLEAKGPIDPESDLESRTTDKEFEPAIDHEDIESKDKEIMAPPKSLPKKAKQYKNPQKRRLDDENNESVKKHKIDNNNTKSSNVSDKNKRADNDDDDKENSDETKKNKHTETKAAKRSKPAETNSNVPVKKTKSDNAGEKPKTKEHQEAKKTKTNEKSKLTNNEDEIVGKKAEKNKTKEDQSSKKPKTNQNNDNNIMPNESVTKKKSDKEIVDKNSEKSNKERTNIDDGKTKTKSVVKKSVASTKELPATKKDEVNINNKDADKNTKEPTNSEEGNTKTKTVKNVTTTKNARNTQSDKLDDITHDVDRPQKKNTEKVTKESTNINNGTKPKTVVKKDKIVATTKNNNTAENTKRDNIQNQDTERPQPNKTIKKAIDKKSEAPSKKSDVNTKSSQSKDKTTNDKQINEPLDKPSKNTEKNKGANDMPNAIKTNSDRPQDKIKKSVSSKNIKNTDDANTKSNEQNKKIKDKISTAKNNDQTVNKVIEKHIMHTKPKEKLSEIRTTVSETNLKSKPNNSNAKKKLVNVKNTDEIRKTVSETNLKSKTSISDPKSHQSVKKVDKIINNKDNLIKTNKNNAENNKIPQTETIKSIKNITANKVHPKPQIKSIKDTFKNIASHKNPLKTQNPQKTIIKPDNPKKANAGNTAKENGQKIVSKIPQKKVSGTRDSLKKNMLRVSPRKLPATLKSVNKGKMLKTTNIPRLQKKPTV